MVLLNIKLIEFLIINNPYYNYFALNINTKTIKDKKKIYNKYLFVIIKDIAINNKSKRINIK